MSSQAEGYFTILEQVAGSGLKIQENIPESVEELIEIDKAYGGKTEDGKPLIVFKTTQGRQFVRLEEWAGNLLLEIPQS